jgi:hypothetical protein
MDGREVGYGGLGFAFFPIEKGHGIDAEQLTGLILGELQFETPFLDVLAQGLGLKIRFLWFQCLKRDRAKWQEGNASLSLWLSGRPQRPLPLYKRTGATLSQPRAGPLLDRIDLHVEVPKVPHHILRAAETVGPTSTEIRQRVAAARHRQLHGAGKLNRATSPREIERYCSLR